MRKAMQNCVEYIRAASSLYEDTATYFKEQQNKFDPSNPENLTIANAKFVISFMKEGFFKENRKLELAKCKKYGRHRDCRDEFYRIIGLILKDHHDYLKKTAEKYDANTNRVNKALASFERSLRSSDTQDIYSVFIGTLKMSYVSLLVSAYGNMIDDHFVLLQSYFDQYHEYNKEMLRITKNTFLFNFNVLKTLYPFFSHDPEIQQTLTHFPVLKAYLNKKWDGDFKDLFLMDCLYSRDEVAKFFEEIPPMFPHLTPEGVPDYFKEKYLAVLGKHAPDFVVEESEKLDELCKKIFAKPKKKRKKKKPANPSQPPLLDPQHDEKDVEDFENAAPPALPIEDKLPEFAPKPVQPERRTKAQKKEDKRIRDQAKIVLQQSTIQAKQTVEDRYEQHHPHIKADHIFDALDQSEKTMMRDIFNHNASPNLNYAKIKTALHHMGITIEEKRGNGDFRKWKLPNGAKVFSFEPAVPQIGHHFLEILRKGLGEKWGVTKEHFEG
jgi:hypothetical protein